MVSASCLAGDHCWGGVDGTLVDEAMVDDENKKFDGGISLIKFLPPLCNDFWHPLCHARGLKKKNRTRARVTELIYPPFDYFPLPLIILLLHQPCLARSLWIVSDTLRYLKHEEYLDNPRQLDVANVARLVKIYELEGCLRLKPTHYIPALVARDHFDRISSIAPETPTEPLTLQPERDLIYLHNRHQIKTARKFFTLPTGGGSLIFILTVCLCTKFLHFNVCWLSIEDINVQLKVSLRDEYSNARNFFDGDIYCHIRNGHLQGKRSEKRKWLARLSKAKQRDVMQLERRAENCRNPEMGLFSQALYELILFRGLWPAFQIGTFHRLLSIRCPAVCTLWTKFIERRFTDASRKWQLTWKRSGSPGMSLVPWRRAPSSFRFHYGASIDFFVSRRVGSFRIFRLRLNAGIWWPVFARSLMWYRRFIPSLKIPNT